METMKCKECGKELSTKAEICPNCGVRVKKKSTFSIIFRVLEIITVIVVLIILIVVVVAVIKDASRKARIKSFYGKWERISSDNRIVYFEATKPVGEDGIEYSTITTIIIDNELEFKEGYVYDGLGNGEGCYTTTELDERCKDTLPYLWFDDKTNGFAISFNDTHGRDKYLCFKQEDKNTIKQINCLDLGEGNRYSSNDGINREYDIVYKRKRLLTK